MGQGMFLYGVGTATGSRLLQHVFPTPLENAQLHSIYEQIKLARDQLEGAQRRHEETIALQRALHRERIEAEMGLKTFQKQLDAWPLSIMAIDMINASERFPHPPLNVIVKVTPGYDGGKQLQPVLRAVSALDREIRQYCRGDLILYTDSPASHGNLRAANLTGWSLISTLNSALRTEAFALLEIEPRDGKLHVDGAFWGWPCEAEDRLGTPIRAGSGLALDLPEDADAARALILDTLLPMIVAIGDMHTLLTRWREAPELHFFRTLAALVEAGRGSNEQAPVLVDQFMRQIERLAPSAAIVAADLAASIALDAHEAGFEDHAETLLASALGHARQAVRAAPADEAALVDALMRVPEAQQGTIHRALIRIRKAAPQLENPGHSGLRASIEEANRHLQTGG
jgi:hypothetical protein